MAVGPFRIALLDHDNDRTVMASRDRSVSMLRCEFRRIRVDVVELLKELFQPPVGVSTEGSKVGQDLVHELDVAGGAGVTAHLLPPP